MQAALMAAVEVVIQRHDRRDDLTITGTSIPLFVDPVDLTIMVEELLDNAFKFSRRGSPVYMRLNETGELQIVDEGRGISPAQIGKIGAFRQFDRHSMEQQGLGLGLSLTQKLAARNHAMFQIRGTEKGICVSLAFSLEPNSITHYAI